MNQITAVLMSYVAPGLWVASTVSSADEALARALGRPLVRVDFSGVSDKDAMMEALARDLSFGDYFGKNFDALEECLNDLSAANTGVIVIENGDLLARAEPKLVATLNHVLEDVSTGSDLSFVWIDAKVDVPAIPNFWL